MPTRYRWSDFVLDLDSYRLERAGAPLSLEPKAFNLLALMIRRPGHVFSKQEIFEAGWPGTAVPDHALTRVVAQLRRVLGDEAREARYLETVPTRGYRWIHPVEEVDVAAGGSKDPPLQAKDPPLHASGILPGLAASLVLAVVALLFLLWAQRGAPTSATGLADSARVNATAGETERVKWPVQVTTHAGLDLQPAISPQGDALAFASDRSGTFEIYIRGIGGTGIDTPLTSDGGFNLQPAWSQDGRLIAFHSSRRGGVWVIPARGGVAKQIVAIGSKPAWSPDGKRIAFQSDEHADLLPTGFGPKSDRPSGSPMPMVPTPMRSPPRIARSAATRRRHGAAMAVSLPSACSNPDRRMDYGCLISIPATRRSFMPATTTSRCSRRTVRRSMSPVARPSSTVCRLTRHQAGFEPRRRSSRSPVVFPACAA